MTKHNVSLLCCRSAVCPQLGLFCTEILLLLMQQRHVQYKLVWRAGWHGVGISTSYEAKIVQPSFSCTWNISSVETNPSFEFVKEHPAGFRPPSVADSVISFWKKPFERRLTSQSLIIEPLVADRCAALPHAAPDSSVPLCLPLTYDAFHCLQYFPQAHVVLSLVLWFCSWEVAVRGPTVKLWLNHPVFLSIKGSAQ